MLNSVTEVGTITTEDRQEDFTNSCYKVSAYAGLRGGGIALKIGVKTGVGVTIAGIFNMDLTFEAGMYFELTALGAVMIGDANDLGLSGDENALFAQAEIGENFSVVGSLDFDVGAYRLLTYDVSFDLWILEISKSFRIDEVKTSFIAHSDDTAHTFSELVFAGNAAPCTFDDIISDLDAEIFKGNTYDGAHTFIIDETGSVVLPNIFQTWTTRRSSRFSCRFFAAGWRYRFC